MSEIGLAGLGVMGKSLSRNLHGRGFSLSVYNRHLPGKEEDVAVQFIKEYQLANVEGYDDIKAFIHSLKRPRKIVLMVEAGQAVDSMLKVMLPHLEIGDVVVDGGNSHFKDTVRRMNTLNEHGVHFLGAGISGGEEGALTGPSIMIGGDRKPYYLVSPYLETIAARDYSGESCCAHVGQEGAGHFVKMVHNGIEYAEMQLLAEVYGLMKNVWKWSPQRISSALHQWNETDLQSYLLEITAEIVEFKKNGEYVLDTILDVAGSKGTGAWTTIAASELGVPVPVIYASLNARYQSSMKKERMEAAEKHTWPESSVMIDINDLKMAYSMARWINHHQGFHLIETASQHYSWDIDSSVLARIWTNGCIIRSKWMENLVSILSSKLPVLMHPDVMAQCINHAPAYARLISGTAFHAQAVPCLESALTYYKSYIQSESVAHLIQAQRDYFGAHTYKRKNDPNGKPIHTIWKKQIE